MPDELTNDQIALLCEVGEMLPPELTTDRKRDLEELIAGGFVRAAEGNTRPAFSLTAKAIEFLGQRWRRLGRLEWTVHKRGGVARRVV